MANSRRPVSALLALAAAVVVSGALARSTDAGESNGINSVGIADKTPLTISVAVDVTPEIAFHPAVVYFSPTPDVLGVPVGSAVVAPGFNVIAAPNPMTPGYYTVECEGRVRTIEDDTAGLN